MQRVLSIEEVGLMPEDFREYLRANTWRNYLEEEPRLACFVMLPDTTSPQFCYVEVSESLLQSGDGTLEEEFKNPGVVHELSTTLERLAERGDAYTRRVVRIGFSRTSELVNIGRRISYQTLVSPSAFVERMGSIARSAGSDSISLETATSDLLVDRADPLKEEQFFSKRANETTIARTDAQGRVLFTHGTR